MAFFGKPVRKPAVGSSKEEDAVSAKIRQDLSRFEQSITDMQSSLSSLNETLTDVYGDSLPRANEFQRALQDENTLLDNFARDVHEVEEPLKRYEHKTSKGSSKKSGLASADGKSEFVGTVLGTLFKGQDVFFSESFKISQVLMDIVTQNKHIPTPREARLNKEIAQEIGVKTDSGGSSKSTAKGGVSPFAESTSHRGPGALEGGSFGSQQPQTRSKSTSAGVKPASRLTSPQSTKAAPARKIYI